MTRRPLMMLALLVGCQTPPGSVPAAGAPVLHRLTQDQINRSLSELFVGAELPEVTLPRDIPVEGFENNALVRDATPYVVCSSDGGIIKVLKPTSSNSTMLLYLCCREQFAAS